MAWVELAVERQSALRASMLRVVGNASDLDEAWGRLLLKLASLDGLERDDLGHLTGDERHAYAFRVAINAAHEVRETERRERRRSVAAQASLPLDSAVGPDVQTFRREIARRLLTEAAGDRELLLDRAAGYSHEEIAERHGLTPDAVRQRLSRLARRARAWISEEWGGVGALVPLPLVRLWRAVAARLNRANAEAGLRLVGVGLTGLAVAVAVILTPRAPSIVTERDRPTADTAAELIDGHHDSRTGALGSDHSTRRHDATTHDEQQTWEKPGPGEGYAGLGIGLDDDDSGDPLRIMLYVPEAVPIFGGRQIYGVWIPGSCHKPDSPEYDPRLCPIANQADEVIRMILPR